MLMIVADGQGLGVGPCMLGDSADQAFSAIHYMLCSMKIEDGESPWTPASEKGRWREFCGKSSLYLNEVP